MVGSECAAAVAFVVAHVVAHVVALVVEGLAILRIAISVNSSAHGDRSQI